MQARQIYLHCRGFPPCCSCGESSLAGEIAELVRSHWPYQRPQAALESRDPGVTLGVVLFQVGAFEKRACGHAHCSKRRFSGAAERGAVYLATRTKGT